MASAHKDIEKILQTCLDSILSGQGTVESALASYPGLEEVLRPQIEAALWIDARKKIFDARPGFITESRKRLESQIQKELSKRPVRPESPIHRFLESLQGRKVALQFSLVLIMLAVFILVSVSGVAYASRETVPGDILYPVKIAQERVEVTFTFSDKGKAQLYTSFAQHRLLEIQVLVLEGRYEFLQSTVRQYENQIGQAVRLVNEVARHNSSEAQALATQLEEVLSGQTMVLEILSKAVPQNRKGEIDNAVDVSKNGVMAMQELRSSITPLSTITPSPSLTNTATPTATPTPTPSISPSPPGFTRTLPARATVSPPSLTASPSAAATISVQIPLTPTPSLKPTQPPAKTDIPLPVATVRPSDTPEPIKTQKTPKPTNTHRPTPQPTNTHHPTSEP